MRRRAIKSLTQDLGLNKPDLGKETALVLLMYTINKLNGI